MCWELKAMASFPVRFTCLACCSCKAKHLNLCICKRCLPGHCLAMAKWISACFVISLQLWKHSHLVHLVVPDPTVTLGSCGASSTAVFLGQFSQESIYFLGSLQATVTCAVPSDSHQGHWYREESTLNWGTIHQLSTLCQDWRAF